MIAFLYALQLCVALAGLPKVDAARACRASVSIVLHAGHHEPALLAAIFAGESGFDPWQVNPSSGACGLGQALYSKDRSVQRRRCRRIVGDLDAGVRAAVLKLDQAADFCRNRPGVLLRCAIAGYQAGPRGVRALERGSRRMVAKGRVVLGRRDQLRAAMGRRPGPAAAIGAGS